MFGIAWKDMITVIEVMLVIIPVCKDQQLRRLMTFVVLTRQNEEQTLILSA